MPLFNAVDLKKLGSALFQAVDVPEPVAVLVADHLVESGLLGHDTHSVLRFPQYVDAVRQGRINPRAQLEILEQTPAMAQVSGGWNYGQVTATAAVELAMDKARGAGFGVVTVKECHHVARLGHFATVAARQNLIALIVANGHGSDLGVAPFGGIRRRLPTNPMCVAIPTAREWPIVLDMTTSMSSGGDLRVYRNLDEPVPAGHIIDAHGQSTQDVEAYYGPPEGAILPLGFPQSGHKGTGLAVIIDILAGTLSGAGCSQVDPPETGNALFIGVLDMAVFVPLEEFFKQTEDFIDWIKSCPPAEGFDEVVLPGENSHRIYQQRRSAGLRVDESAWTQINELATALEVDLPEPLQA